MQEKLQIVFITDDKFVVPTGVAIYSLIRNKNPETECDIYVVCSGVDVALKEKLLSLSAGTATVHIVEPRNGYEIPDASHPHVSRTALLKFDLPNLFPNLSKILYLDGDILVQSDLTELYRTDISDVFLAAVGDMPVEKDLKWLDAVGVARYFNSGVMLLNLERMRLEGVTQQLVVAKSERRDFMTMDQDVFNHVFSERVHWIDPKYNAIVYNLIEHGYTLQEVNEHHGTDCSDFSAMIRDACVLHLTNRVKPWRTKGAFLNRKWYSYYHESGFGSAIFDEIAATDDDVDVASACKDAELRNLRKEDERLRRETEREKLTVDSLLVALRGREEEIRLLRSSFSCQIERLLNRAWKKACRVYYGRLKSYIPRSVFSLWNSIEKITSWIGKIGRKYLALFTLGLGEFQLNGAHGLLFAIRRHQKKRRGERIVGYPTKNDYVCGRVTIAILSGDDNDCIRSSIRSIKRTKGLYAIEVLIGITEPLDRQTLRFFRNEQNEFVNFRIIRFPEYSFSRNYNDIIATYATGEHVVFFESGVIANEGWLDALLRPLEDRRIGVVGSKLLNCDGTIRHAGIEYKIDGSVFYTYRGEPADFSDANVLSAVPGVTFAGAAMRHDVFDRFHFSEDFRDEMQDVDLGLRLSKAGFRVLYQPKSELIQSVEKSRKYAHEGAMDRNLFWARWSRHLERIILSGVQRTPFDPDEYMDAIIVIRDDGIGDLLMGVSSFQKLRNIHKDKRLVLFTYERNVGLMKGFGIFDEVLPIPNGRKYSPLPVPTIGTTVYDFIDLEMHFGNSFAETKEDNKIHRQVVFSRDFGLDDGYIPVSMPDYPAAKSQVFGLLRKLEVSENDSFVVLNLIASNPARSWWEPYYEPLIAAIEEAGFVPVVVGTKDSEYFRGKRLVNLVGKTKNIEEYVEAVKLGSYVISTDTSACHVAGLANIPFLAIFTGGVPASARLGYYEKYEVLEPEGLPCFPCWDEGCKDLSIRHKKEPCRLMLTPDRVIMKFKDLVQKNNRNNYK